MQSEKFWCVVLQIQEAIHFLFFLVLYIFAFLLISKFKKRKEYYFAGWCSFWPLWLL
ncbi:unnamed protein product [Ixodes pacificus]